eukprot:TRINITY_DN7651_c0_g2_i1.p4 TRINITY_DN7651_c0_g2~~TRINITY_DN7651_c0_g2_i1.p4  ORF type:complete len:100 (-),score=4.71 TRINITY_DN7651_c0_g2_i1:310-609(-)
MVSGSDTVVQVLLGLVVPGDVVPELVVPVLVAPVLVVPQGAARNLAHAQGRARICMHTQQQMCTALCPAGTEMFQSTVRRLKFSAMVIWYSATNPVVLP